MKGRITKGIAGFYYVYAAGSGMYECKPKGIFRKEKIKPLVGDYVEFEVLDETERTGVITVIAPRKNELIRPASSNIDQAMVIFAIENPRPSFSLLDRFLIMMERQEIETTVCFNKSELASQEELNLLRRTYSQAGYQVLLVSARQEVGIEQIKKFLEGKTTVVAGPSGVGKSTITNLLQKEVRMETGEISRKLKRGRHTTRHAQLLAVNENTFIMDTPGFSAIAVEDMPKEELKKYFPEFHPFEDVCRFQGCVHISEPDCGVIRGVKDEKISSIRYESYKELYEELKEKEKRRY
ncbi:MAG: ribosome small subunit-dependent GTPase A [Ruminococcus sp.]